MTLLETLIALVILSLAAVGLLEVFQTTSSSTADARTWVAAVAYAQQGVEAAKVGAVAIRETQGQSSGFGLERTIETRQFREGLAEIVVTVSLPRGGRYVLHRLVSDTR